MGYFDVQTNSWVCQDKCLKPSSNHFVCGSTNHFTNFGVLLEGSSSGCDPQYIFGKAVYDSILALGIAGIVVCCGIMILAFGSTKIGRRLIAGKEAERIRNTRTKNFNDESKQTIDF